MTHELKTWEEFMRPIAKGQKTFELRLNDRGFSRGDTLLLQGYLPNLKQYTGEVIEAEVVYFLDGEKWGIMEGYCVMGIKVKNYNF